MASIITDSIFLILWDDINSFKSTADYLSQFLLSERSQTWTLERFYYFLLILRYKSLKIDANYIDRYLTRDNEDAQDSRTPFISTKKSNRGTKRKRTEESDRSIKKKRKKENSKTVEPELVEKDDLSDIDDTEKSQNDNHKSSSSSE